jgi:hypothetical protein
MFFIMCLILQASLNTVEAFGLIPTWINFDDLWEEGYHKKCPWRGQSISPPPLQQDKVVDSNKKDRLLTAKAPWFRSKNKLLLDKRTSGGETKKKKNHGHRRPAGDESFACQKTGSFDTTEVSQRPRAITGTWMKSRISQLVSFRAPSSSVSPYFGNLDELSLSLSPRTRDEKVTIKNL